MLNVSRRFRTCRISRLYVVAAATVFSLSVIAAGQRNAPSTLTYTNHLIREKSPYLLLRAHNPSIGTHGEKKHLRKRDGKTSRSSSRSVITRVTGAT
jgi:hypothetical protein